MKSATELKADLLAGKLSAVALAEECLQAAEKQKDLGAFLRLDAKRILASARASDARLKKGQAGALEGIPVSIKDNICEEGERTTCASRMLENFVAPYDATVIARLKAAGAVLFGRTNMDEFAMGSSTENSAFQKTYNPWQLGFVPGGSSGGAAASVAAGIVPLALGSDTGGSIRQPAAFCGIMGLKPTYGMVSRYGLVAFASSLDQIGPMATTSEDLALLLSVIKGRDVQDATSAPQADLVDIKQKKVDFKKLRVGLLGFNRSICEGAVVESMQRAVSFLKEQGATLVELPFELEDALIPVYYVLAPAEASSNLSRYDGIRYGYRSERSGSLLDLYTHSRSEGFGPEVKRRILTGTYVLSSGYYDAYYKRAQAIRALIQKSFQDFFTKVDVILQPTTPTAAFRVGEKLSDPIAMYQSDVLTVAANLAGVPALSLPVGLSAEGMPIGLQLTAAPFEDGKLLNLATAIAAQKQFQIGLPGVSASVQKAATAGGKGRPKMESGKKPPVNEASANKARTKKEAVKPSGAAGKKSSGKKGSGGQTRRS